MGHFCVSHRNVRTEWRAPWELRDVAGTLGTMREMMRDSRWPSPQRQGSPGGEQRGQRRQVERRCRGSVRRARRGCPVRGVGEEVCGSAVSLRLGPRGRPAGARGTAGAAPRRRRARAGFGVAGTSQTQSRPSQPERRRLRADPGDARPRDTDRAAGSHAALTTRRDNDLGGARVTAGDCPLR